MSNRGDLLRVRARFRETQAKQEPRLNRFIALMGDGQGNLAVSGSPLFVYVRVQGRGVVECLNQVAPLRNDLPIIVGYDFKKPDTLQVLSVYEGGITSFGPYAYLPAHHQAHEFRHADGGDDVVWVQKQAVIPLLCRPTSPTTMFVAILEDNYPWLSAWNLFPTTTSADLTARIPALPGDARFVLIYIDGATNTLGYSNGAIFPAAWPPGTAFSLVPAPPAGSVPVAAIYLPNGITAIDWDEIYDLRLFNQPIGGSVTPGAHALLDVTVHSDTATNTPPARGSLTVANATPAWDELVHPGGAGYALTTDATDVIWDQTPAWTGAHTFNAGLIIGAGQGITLPDPGWIGFGPAAERLTMVTGVPDVAEFIGFGQLNIENVLGHIGDPDTYLIFAPDSIVLRAGGVDLIHATTVGVDRVEINPNEDDVDFIVNSNGLADTLLVDGATGAISVTGPSLTVPATWDLIIQDNVADAFSIDDNGAADVFLQIVTTTGSEEVIFNAGGDDIDFTVQAVGVADAFQVQGSDGQITLGALTAGFVKSSAGGVLSVALEVALAELAGYVRGSIIRGGAADWEALAHPGAAGHALVSTALDIVWSSTPAWTNTHSFAAGIDFVGVSGANNLTVNDNIAIALELLDAGGLEYMRIVSTDANPYFLIDPAAGGILTGIGLAAPIAPLEVQGSIGVVIRAVDESAVTNAVRNFFVGHVRSTGNMADGFGPQMVFSIEDNALAINNIGVFNIVRANGVDNSGRLQVATYNGGVQNIGLVMSHLGYVGIETLTPWSILQLNKIGAGNLNDGLIIGDLNGGGTTVGLSLSTSAANVGYIYQYLYGTGWGDIALQPVGGRVGIGCIPTALFEVKGTATDDPLTILDALLDDDSAFVNYQGVTAASAAKSLSSWAVANALGHIKVQINGTDRWLRYYDTPTS